MLLLKIARKIYSGIFALKSASPPSSNTDADYCSDLIREALNGDTPLMIARFGSNELRCVVNYIGIKKYSHEYLNYLRGKTPAWWWEESVVSQLINFAGFFPKKTEEIDNFCELMLEDMVSVDILGSWLPDENFFQAELKNSQKVFLELLNPYFSTRPWTWGLQGKRVLVIHPFVETIERQFKNRKFLFKNNLLPDFELKTIKAVQSIAGEKTEHNTWFDALNYMKAEMDRVDYDICLIGCGAYGFPLAAHAKRMGKIGFHLGGSLQLLFGIRGKRWENPNYNSVYNYAALMNEYWVKPADEERPVAADKVEGACYW